MFAVDRIEDGIIVLQDLDNKEIVNENLDLMPEGVSEGSILRYENDEYVLDDKAKEERLRIIQEKLNKAKNN